MVNIKEITNKEIVDRILDYESNGGVVQISVFEILENYLGEMPTEYDVHLFAARQTLEKAIMNQHFTFTYAQTDFTKLDSSGIRIDAEQFIGPYFDLGKNKPYIRGQLGNSTVNSYFYYDIEEKPENRAKDLYKQFLKKYPNSGGGLIYTIMEPPYSLTLGKDIRKRGEYLLNFLEFFFSDLSKIVVYAWDIDCSPIFDAGKEWWGSYFWTVYNPTKQWYIGIIASATD